MGFFKIVSLELFAQAGFELIILLISVRIIGVRIPCAQLGSPLKVCPVCTGKWVLT
jgi:hypothetical protein